MLAILELRLSDTYEHASWFVRNKRKVGIFDTGIECDFVLRTGKRYLKEETRRIWCNADASRFWVDCNKQEYELNASQIAQVEAMQQIVR